MSMKKILLAIGMLAVLCTALCACGGEGAAKEPTLEDMLTKEMEGEVLSTVWNRYGFLQTDITTTTVKKVDEYEYQMWGKVTVTDEVISQILCKHRFRCKTEQNIFKAGAAEAVSALSTK